MCPVICVKLFWHRGQVGKAVDCKSMSAGSIPVDVSVPYAKVAQRLEQNSYKVKVDGSNPSLCMFFCGSQRE